MQNFALHQLNKVKPIHFVLFVAIVLRVAFLFISTYTHDELSALSRLNFNSFSDLIQYGVKPDGHPAFIQVFLYYWTTIVGFTPWLVKLPFCLMGIGSVYLIYWLGKKWYNELCGIFASAAMATLQFPVYYSLIARPYISGVFLILLCAVFITRFIQLNRMSYGGIIGYILVAFLCAINHHFSALTLAILVLASFFVTRPDQRLKYILANLGVVVLYAMHIPITITQINYGGLGGENGWLGKPDAEFILRFFGYVVMFSWPVIIAVIMVTIGLFNNSTKFSKHSILFILVFLLPFIVGFLYSIFISPIIQYSFLIFGFPFLLLVVFSRLTTSTVRKPLILLVLLILVNAFVLVRGRDFSHMISDNSFSSGFAQVQGWKQRKLIHADSTLYVYDESTNYFLLNAQAMGIEATNYHSYSDSLHFNLLKNKKYNRLVAINLTPEHLRSVKCIFGETVETYASFLTDVVLLKRGKSEQPFAFIDFSNYKYSNHPAELQHVYNRNYSHDTLTGKRTYTLPPNCNIGPSIEFGLNEHCNSVYNTITAVIETSGISEGLSLGICILDADSVVHWRTIRNKGNGIPLTIGVHLQHVFKNEIAMNKGRCRIFVSSNGTQAIQLKSLKVFMNTWNKKFYGLNSPF